jgi:hypothetical protein
MLNRVNRSDIIYIYVKPLYKNGDTMKQITLQLSEETIKKAKRIAELEQLPYTVMFRNWIAQRIREYTPYVEPAKTTTEGAVTPGA